jgi:NAD(P)-dependent dehydrogenase (short-subunit alcohol dehydrogenase family)
MATTRDLFDLKGKVALVTGGSRGLGLQIAEGLGDMGCKVAITARKADELAEAKKHLRARHRGRHDRERPVEVEASGDGRRGGRATGADRHPRQQRGRHVGRARPRSIPTRPGAR